MRGQGFGVHQIREEKGGDVGVFAGMVVKVVSSRRDAENAMHFSVRLPNGEVDLDVHEDEISFDQKIVQKISH